MRIFKYFKLRSFRRLILQLPQWYSLRRLVFIIIFSFILLTLFLVFYYSVLIIYLNYYCFSSANIIISLTTTSRRFQDELPFTIHSLLTQTKLPKEIRIYLSEKITDPEQTIMTLNQLKKYVRNVDSSIVIGKLFDQLVHLLFQQEDHGPATKFLPILREFHLLKAIESQSQAIIICDDDHYYHPYMLDVLLQYSKEYKNTIVGLRGWRIRKDLQWGVSDAKEYSYHVVESARISEPYRVGIVTANNAYIIRPSFFDNHIYDDFQNAPDDIRRVDDIWLNGYASRRNITRLVIPTCCTSISITRTHELENYFISHHMTRGSANDHALKWFNHAWEKNIWYRFKGENRPQYRNWLIGIYREWINIILRLKFMIYVGFS